MQNIFSEKANRAQTTKHSIQSKYCKGKTEHMEMDRSFLCRIRSISILCLLINILCCEAKSNTITQGQVFRDGETLVSADGSFEFGFFSPPNSTLRYVGIWYSNISVGPYVWVANRNAPIADRNGSFTIGYEGNLLVYNGTGKPVWSSNTEIFSNNYTAVLQNNGNFEIRGNYSSPGYEFTCWQSFDNPTDTYLPGMKVLVSERVGESKIFTSWKSSNDPSTGNFTMGVDPRAAPQVVIWEGLNRRWRSGHFNGMKFTGVPTMSSFYYYGFKISNPDPEGNMYLSYDPQSGIQKFKFIISWDGYEKSLVSFNGGGIAWSMLQSEPSSICDIYNTCGSNGYCMNSVCGCFRGFKPKNQEEWQNGNWSGGCVRKTELQCERNQSLIGQDGFLRVDGVKLPDFADLIGNISDDQECEKHCSLNCSCTAYAYASGIGCMTWGGELIDIELFPQDGNKMYIRVASSDLGSKLSGPKIAAIVLGGVIFVSLIILLLWKFRAKLKARGITGESSGVLTMGLRSSRGYSTDISGSVDLSGEGNLVQAPDLPLINYNLVALATNFFAQENKLGQGGFGPVYKGVLPGGQEIAVKKLSRKSGQGMEEFKNEIRLIAKLQHRNLVRILGCCVQGEEKILVYEYMPNKSLDSFIFDSSKKGQIDWKKRMKIIEGIARGLLYLHRDARCTIIHRDLKASNILLDQDMNPKISDFGMAKIFGGDQDRANTNRVVGTYGYMSPEYAMEGYFSDKSDVYSFGVLLLEVVTGRRNTSFRSSEHMSLIEYAWELWSEGKVVELADPSIRISCTSNEVNRCVHIALLCVQDSACHRPAMSHVVLWLESDSVALPIPKQPTMTLSSRSTEREWQNGGNDVESKNNLTITMIVPR